jgi:hypothetical protein
VEDVLKSEYAKTPIILSGFDTCTSRSQNTNVYKIYEYDSKEWSPRVSGIGTKAIYAHVLNGIEWNLLLNHTFENWATGCKSSEDTKDNCITSTALHEVGHLLGLRHEHPRASSTCIGWNEELESDVIEIGQYDPQSIMNYCEGGTFDWSRNKRRLSSGDIATLWFLYGNLYREGWSAMVSRTQGTVLKRTSKAANQEDRCQLGYQSSWTFTFEGMTADNHMKVRLLSQDVINACRSKLNGDTAYIYPPHFKFCRATARSFVKNLLTGSLCR